MSLIKCENIALAYDGKEVASDISFQVNRNDYLCIVGENGSGKSSLIKAILGLIKPTRGQIVFGDGLRQSEIGYLPQQTAVQKDFPASVNEVVLSGCLNSSRAFAPFYTKEQKNKAYENMERLRISDLKDKCYRELSGGQQQRVLLARALCATKSILLLDEPVTGLDPIVTSDFYKLINEINVGMDITVIMVSHDIASAVENSTHILHLQHKQLFYGKTKDYLETDIGKYFSGNI
ncbi:MAG: metal ABC transporter ATP-binding protein [Ruminococcaceae bacterium]|nr:metal ABC transporter ATP-binding protein [Oscillospiraceae bacterium]